MMITEVKEFFDPATWTLTYVVFNPKTHDALVIDAVWDYDPAASKLSFKTITPVVDFIATHKLKIHWILETHAHADHVTGAQELKKIFPTAKIGIGSRITEVQKTFKTIFDMPDSFHADGSQFDHIFTDEEVIHAGAISFKVLFTPGHTPACCSYIIENRVFTGDTLFMPDSGTGRCDFPAGSAEELYHSIHERIYKLPEHYQIFVGHDYQPGGRPLKFSCTIQESKNENIQIKESTQKADFIHFRTHRDKTLSAPRLLLPSLQINIDAGRPPAPNSAGAHFLKIPLKLQ